MKITQQSESCSIECTYDSKEDKEHFIITLPLHCGIAIRISIYLLDELIETLQRFSNLIKVTTRRRSNG